MSEDLSAVEAFLTEIEKAPKLTHAQEFDLAMRIEAGVFADEELNFNQNLSQETQKELKLLVEEGKRSKNLLLTSNLFLVYQIASKHEGEGLPLMQLIQEGNLGLIRAVEKFDYTIEKPFSEYAQYWVRSYVSLALKGGNRTIRIPMHMVEAVNKISQVRENLLQVLGREPSIEELAAELDMPPEKVVEISKYGREPISMPGLHERNSGVDFESLIKDSEALQPEVAVNFTLLQEQLNQVLGSLTVREAGVISERFGLVDGQPKTLEQIGKIFGVSRERIRQIENKVMWKLRHPSRSQVLKDYLE